MLRFAKLTLHAKALHSQQCIKLWPIVSLYFTIVKTCTNKYCHCHCHLGGENEKPQTPPHCSFVEYLQEQEDQVRDR